MLGLFLGAGILPASPHLLLWQYHHTPVLPHPWTCNQPQPLLLTGADCTAPFTWTLHHLLLWAPQVISSQQSHTGLYQPFTLLHAAIYPSFSLPSLIPTGLFAQAPHLQFLRPDLIAAVTYQHNAIRERPLSPYTQNNQLLSGSPLHGQPSTHRGWGYA